MLLYSDDTALSLLRQLIRLLDDIEAKGLLLMQCPDAASEGQRVVAEVIAARDGLIAGLREMGRGWMFERLAMQARLTALHEPLNLADRSRDTRHGAA